MHDLCPCSTAGFPSDSGDLHPGKEFAPEKRTDKTSMIDYLEQGIARAHAELAHPPGAGFAPEEMGTVWKYALVALLLAHCGGAAACRSLPRDALTALAERRLPELAAAREGLLFPEPLQHRIITLAVDAVKSERLCPELLLAPEALMLHNRPVHALIFSAFPYITNELYPLLVDALVAGAAVQVVGVHESWLTGATFRRAILPADVRAELVEAEISVAPPISSAQVLRAGFTPGRHHPPAYRAYIARCAPGEPICGRV